MPGTIKQIRAGLAENLSALVGVQVSSYTLSSPTPPSAEIEPGEIDYDKAMQRGLDEITMVVRVFVGLTTDQGAQASLDEFMDASGSRSVKTLIESDPTLSGTVQDVHVTGCSGYRIYARQGQAPVFGAEWAVRVFP